jgi:hypothetical protein
MARWNTERVAKSGTVRKSYSWTRRSSLNPAFKAEIENFSNHHES